MTVGPARPKNAARQSVRKGGVVAEGFAARWDFARPSKEERGHRHLDGLCSRDIALVASPNQSRAAENFADEQPKSSFAACFRAKLSYLTINSRQGDRRFQATVPLSRIYGESGYLDLLAEELERSDVGGHFQPTVVLLGLGLE